MATFALSEYPKKDVSVDQTVAEYAIDGPLDKVTADKLGNGYDRRDMHRMGKTQELRVCGLVVAQSISVALADLDGDFSSATSDSSPFLDML